MAYDKLVGRIAKVHTEFLNMQTVEIRDFVVTSFFLNRFICKGLARKSLVKHLFNIEFAVIEFI